MKSFFEEIGKKIGETAETVTNKAGEAVEVQRLKNQIRSLEKSNERDLIELGKTIYDKFSEGASMEDYASELCGMIQSRKESIANYSQQIVDVQGKKKCPDCGMPVGKEMSYCPYCGTKVPEDEKEDETSEDMAEDETESTEECTTQETAEGGAENEAENFADAVKEKAADMAEKAVEKVEDAADAVKDKAEEVMDKIKDSEEDEEDNKEQ